MSPERVVEFAVALLEDSCTVDDRSSLLIDRLIVWLLCLRWIFDSTVRNQKDSMVWGPFSPLFQKKLPSDAVQGEATVRTTSARNQRGTRMVDCREDQGVRRKGEGEKQRLRLLHSMYGEYSGCRLIPLFAFGCLFFLLGEVQTSQFLLFDLPTPRFKRTHNISALSMSFSSTHFVVTLLNPTINHLKSGPFIRTVWLGRNVRRFPYLQRYCNDGRTEITSSSGDSMFSLNCKVSSCCLWIWWSIGSTLRSEFLRELTQTLTHERSFNNLPELPLPSNADTPRTRGFQW